MPPSCHFCSLFKAKGAKSARLTLGSATANLWVGTHQRSRFCRTMDGTAAGSGCKSCSPSSARTAHGKNPGCHRVKEPPERFFQGWRFFEYTDFKKYYPSFDCPDRRSGRWGDQFPIYDPYPITRVPIRPRTERRQIAQTHLRF